MGQNRHSARRSPGDSREKARVRRFRKLASATLVQVAAKHGLETQAKLADCLGITTRQLRDWVSGRACVNFETVDACEPLADFFEAFAEARKRVAG